MEVSTGEWRGGVENKFYLTDNWLSQLTVNFGPFLRNQPH